MADKRITDLPLILSGDITSTDVLPIVNVNLDITNKIEVDQLKSYILNGVNDYYVTGGTYNPNNGIATFTNNNGDTFDVSGFLTGYTNFYTTGATLSGTTIFFDRTDLLNAYDVNLSSLIIYSSGTGTNSTYRVGLNNVTSGNFSLVSGGYYNTTLDSYSTISGGYCNTTNSGSGCNFIGNGEFNTISAYYGRSVIVGGGNNKTYDGYRSVENNFIGGGSQNTSSGYFSTVVGGIENCSFGNCSFVGGGRDNIAFCRSTISGGRRNTAGTSGSVYSVNINGAYDGTGVAQGTYSVYTNTISPSVGFGLRLLITFDSFGVITNTEIEQGGNLYSSGGDQVVVPGILFAGGSSPLNDVTYDITNTITNSYASIIGGCGNKAIGYASTISGGYDNTNSGYASTISGGYNNLINESFGVIAGGCNNQAKKYASTIGGGIQNTTDNQYDTISGGRFNTTLLSGFVVGAATISGGYCNTSGNYYTFNGGGCNNKTLGEFSTIVGGQNNQNISGLVQQVSFSFGDSSTIPDNTYSVYPTNNGGYGSGLLISFDINTGIVSNINVVNPGIRYEQGQQVLVSGVSIGGLSPTNDLYFNLDQVIEGHYSFIGGGYCNTSSGLYSTVSGGVCNTASGKYSTIGGGGSSSGYSGHLTLGCYSVIAGGNKNTTSGDCSTIGGGVNNQASGKISTVSGGQHNTSNVDISTIGGGRYNTVNGDYSVIGGGISNTILNTASGILGGVNNTSQNTYSFIIGSGIYSTSDNTTHMNCLNLKDIPDDPGPGVLPSGTVYRCSADSNRLYICI